jgi:cytochrome c biogenesis protein CcmG/thiol:disulfide interchange protein DsbE
VKRFAVVIALVGSLGLLLAYATYLMYTGDYAPKSIPSPLVGKPLPSFALQNLTNPKQTITPQSLHGRVYLLNVWASWCPSCRMEHPIFNELARRKIVPIIGLNYKDKTEDALKWLGELGNPYEMSLVLDAKAGIDLFGVYGAPETFVIDKRGVIRYKHIGPVSEKDWNEKLLPLVQELVVERPSGA